MNSRASLLAVVIIILTGYIISSYLPINYLVPYYLTSSLALSFFPTYFAVPKFLRKGILNNNNFHRRVFANFIFYVLLGLILYVLL